MLDGGLRDEQGLLFRSDKEVAHTQSLQQIARSSVNAQQQHLQYRSHFGSRYTPWL